MSSSNQKDESFSAILEDLSAKLRLISSNSKFMQPKYINLEIKNLSNSVQGIATIFLKGRNDNRRNKFSSELADVSYEIDQVLHFFSTNRDIHKVASELKAICTKLEKISKKLGSNINMEPKQDDTTKMILKNTPIETLTISVEREDKEKIINLLLQSQPCIVPIIHKYKSNCTKFARDIFEDKRVSKHFTRRIWVDAPRLIDVKMLKKLVQKRPSTLFWVIKTLNKDLEEECVLLVLDDIKKELEFRSMCIRLSPISTRSKIVISTSETVYVSNETWDFERSRKLSVDEAWEVIKKEKVIKNLEVYEEIGKEMLSKMERWGSMVRALRILLSRNKEAAYWNMMTKSQFWRIPCHHELLSKLLRLCYDMSLLGYEVPCV